MRLDQGAAGRVIEQFGFDRVNWALQATVQRKDYDGRFRSEHKEWAKEAFTHYVRDETRQYLVDSHPAVLDGFIAQARRTWWELNLFDQTHCHENNANQDYHGKVLVLKPGVLADAYKTPESQLFLCTGGFGASAGARGRKVYGQFLSDGEQCQFQRQDFLGVLKDERLPDWSREKLEQAHQQEQKMEEPSL